MTSNYRYNAELNKLVVRIPLSPYPSMAIQEKDASRSSIYKNELGRFGGSDVYADYTQEQLATEYNKLFNAFDNGTPVR